MQTVRLPEWLRRPPASAPETRRIKQLLRQVSLNTVCEEARCPNISECFSRGTATFMILGDICTRGCRFCSVTTGKPEFSEDNFQREAEHVAAAAETMGLKHVVVTSVARDDLSDGGASGFAYTIAALRERIEGVVVEVLTPDFRGRESAIEIVVDACPDILNHNVETVPRLYRRVRPGASYEGSLKLLQRAKKYAEAQGYGLKTKSGIMLGLGETGEEVRELISDCRNYSIDIFTAGQYMQPSREHLPVAEYVTPEAFESYRRYAKDSGFYSVAVGPLVRSSYHAEEVASG